MNILAGDDEHVMWRGAATSDERQVERPGGSDSGRISACRRTYRPRTSTLPLGTRERLAAASDHPTCIRRSAAGT
jgi:hypothetical protein